MKNLAGQNPIFGNAAAIAAAVWFMWMGALASPAATNYWVDSGTDWATGANWLGGTPGATDVGAFTNATSLINSPTLGGSQSVGALWKTAAGGVSINGSGQSLTLGGLNNFYSGYGTVGLRADSGSGAITIAPDITLGASQNWINNGVNSVTLNGALTGSGINLSLLGSGTFEFTADNSGYSGVTTINKATNILSGANGAISSGTGITILNNGALTIDNTSSKNDRLGTSQPLTASGGTLTLLNPAATQTEKIGALTLNEGALRINTASAGTAGTLTIASVTRNAASSVYFTGAGLGTANNKITFTATPSLGNSIIRYVLINDGGVVDLATLSGNDLAKYTSYTTSSGAPAWGNTVNARPNGAILLGGAKSLNSLVLDNGIGFTAPSAASTVTMTGGGPIVQTGGTSTINAGGTGSGNYYTFAFGGSEAIYNIVGTLNHLVRIGNTYHPYTGTAGLTKTGPGSLVIGSDTYNDIRGNSLSGGLRLNEGAFEIYANNAAALSGFGTITFNGGNLTVHSTASLSFNNAITVNADSSITLDRRTGSTGGGVTSTFGAIAFNNNATLTVDYGPSFTSGFPQVTAGTVTLNSPAVFRIVSGSGVAPTLQVNAISDGGTGYSVTKSGGGILIYNTDNTYGGETVVTGRLRLNTASGIPGGIGATGGSSALTLNGGVLELNFGDFQRALGPSVDQFQIIGGSSGFTAGTATRTVNIGGAAATITWGSTYFKPSTLAFNGWGSSTALNFSNGLDLNGADRTINVGTQTVTMNGAISSTGGGGLIKTGAGTLALANAGNSFTGLTVNAGTVQFGANGNLGAAGRSITLDGNTAALQNTTGTTLVDLGSRPVIVENTGIVSNFYFTSRGNLTIGGPVSGGGGVGMVSGGFWGKIRFDSTANTFSGPIYANNSVDDGGGNNSLFSLNSIYDAPGVGGIYLNGTIANVGIDYGSGGANGAGGGGATSPLVLNYRQIFVTNNVGVIFNNASAQDVTINTALGFIGTAGTARSIRFGYSPRSGSGTNYVNGLLADNGVGGTLSLTFGGGVWVATNNNTFSGSVSLSAGTLSLLGLNTYTGSTSIQGTLIANTIRDFGTASSLGAPLSGDILYSNFAASRLVYTGSGDTANRTIWLAGDVSTRNNNSGVYNNGTGALVFSGTTFNAVAGGSGGRTTTLILGGTYTGSANEIRGIIRDNDPVYANNNRIGIAKTNACTWKLSGANTYTGLTSVNGGTLMLDASTGSLYGTSPYSALTFGGSGTFNYDNTTASGARSQNMGALTFSAGAGTLTTTRTAAQTVSLTFSSLAARTAGATGNFVVNGGVNGTDNKIVLSGAATGAFLDKGFYFGGSEYAAYDTGGYVRALAYGSDANAVAVGTITASRHVKLTATPANQNAITLLSLNLAGSGVNWTQNNNLSLTVPAIIKSGGGSSTISGTGTATVSSGGNVELVIRTDTASDSLVITIPANNGNNPLTKSGAGTLTLQGASTSSGSTFVNEGTLLVNNTTGNGIGTGTVTVRLGAKLGGTGTIGGSVVVDDGGGLTFDLITPSGSHDTLALATAKTLTFSGTSTLTIASSGGTPSPGTYTLLTAPGGISGAVPATVILPPGWTADAPQSSGGNLTINITAAGNTPTIAVSGGALASVNTTYGTASSPTTSFTVSGAALTEGITITPPVGFEVSTTSGFTSNVGDNAAPIVVGAAGTVPTTTVYVRLKATAPVSGSPYSGDIVCSSSGATSVNKATASSTVSPAPLTITGLTGDNKVYDGNAIATFSGTAAYLGLQNGESFSVSGTPSASFANANAGNSKAITVSGYTAPSGNYTLTQPSLTADITPKALSITAPAVTKVYDATTAGGTVIPGTLSGFVGSETVTASGTATAYASKNVGASYSVTVSYVLANGLNGGLAANYSLASSAINNASITAKALTLAGLTAANKCFDNTTAVTLSGTAALQASETAGTGSPSDGKPYTGDDVSLTGTASGSFASVGPGGGLTVNITGLSLAGTEYANYTLTSSLTANINSDPLIWVAGNGTWDYVTSTPWNNSVTFLDCSNVRFDDTPGSSPTITLNTTVSPQSITNESSTRAFTISGSGSIAGSGPLYKAGSSTLTLSVPGTYSGDTTINGGTLTLGVANVLPDGAGKGNLLFNPASGTATLDLNGKSETINGLSNSGAGSSVIDGKSGTPVLTIGNNDQSSTFSGVITDSGGTLSLIKTGSGTLTLGAANTYAGTTTVDGGELRYGILNAINSANSVTISSGGTLNVGNFASTIVGVTLNKGGTLTGGNANYTQTGTFTLADGGTVNGFSSPAFFNLGGPLNYTSSGASSVKATINRLGAGAATRTLTIASGSDPSGVDLDITEVLMGNGAFNMVKDGAGVMRLSGSTPSSGRSSGSTTINNGTLLLNKSSSVEAIGGTGAITIGDGSGGPGTAVLRHETGSADNQILDNAVNINNTDGLWDLNGHTETTSGAVSIQRGGRIDLNGGNLTLGATTYIGFTTVNTTPIINTAGGGTLALTSTLTITPSAGFDTTFNLNGATMTLGNTVTFNPATDGRAQITGGTLALGGNRTFSVVVGSGSTYDLDIDGPVTGTTFTFTHGSNGRLQFSGSTDNTYSGLTTVNGAGALLLNKTGSAQAIAGGGLIVGTANNSISSVTYTGGSSDMMGNGTLTINGRSRFDFNGHTDTIGNVVIVNTSATSDALSIRNTAGGGNLTIGTLGITPVASLTTVINAGVGGTITLGGNVTFTAATTGRAQITGGTLDLGATGRTFTIGLGTGADQDVLVDAVIAGSGVGLTKAGTGRLALSGINTYSGPTAVNAGTLLVMSPGSLDTASAVTVGSGGTLGGDGTINGPVAINAGGTLVGDGIINDSVVVNAGGTLASAGTLNGVVTAASGGIIRPAASGVAGTMTLTDAGNALTLNGDALYFDVMTSDGSSRDQVAITGNLVVNGVNTLYINAPSGISVGTYTLISYAAKTGSGSIVFSNGSTTMGDLTLDFSSGTDVKLIVTADFDSNVWKSYVNGTWDINSTANWMRNGIANSVFLEGDNVLFDDSAATKTVTGGTINPGSVTVNNTANYVISANIGGSGTQLIKVGSGSLTLTGANSYSGGILLDAGEIQLTSASTAASLGDPANVLTFTGSSTLNLQNVNPTFSQGVAVNEGVTATFYGNDGRNFTIGGALTGSGTLKVRGNGNYHVNFTNANNTFSGDITLGAATGGYIGQISMNSLADTPGSHVSLGETDRPGVFNYGAGAVVPLVLSNRGFEMSGTTAGGTLNNNATDANSTVTVNTSLSVTGSGNKTFTLGGSNLGNNTFAGVIGDGTSAVISLSKADGGKWILSNNNTFSGSVSVSAGTLVMSGNNTFSGTIGVGGGTLVLSGVNSTPAKTTVSGGTLSINSIANYGVNCSIGKGTAGTPIQVGGNGSSPTLIYTGGTADTDRQIMIGYSGNTSGGYIYNNGTGALTFTATTFNQNAGVVASARMMNLGGTYVGGTNKIEGAIVYSTLSTDDIALTKLADASIWHLSGVNTYSGPTAVKGGTLRINSPGSLASGSAVSIDAGATLGGDGTISGTVNAANAAGGILDPGSAANTIGALTLGNAGATALTVNGYRLNFDLPASGSVCDLIAITGTLVVNGINTVYLDAPGGSVPPGTYTLMTYGAKSGSGSIVFANGSITMGNASLTVGANSVTVTIGAGGLGQQDTWKGTVSGVWDGGALNWTKGGAPLQAFADGDSVTFDNSATTFTVTSGGTVQPNSVVVNNTTGYTISAPIAGSLTPLFKQGAGSLTLSGSNSYGGDTTVSAGILKLGASNVIPDGSGKGNVVLSGTATLDMGGFDDTINGLTGASGNFVDNTVGGSAYTLTVGGNDQSSTFAGVIKNASGSVALTKTGAGTLTLTGLNTYGGGTIVNGGTLALDCTGKSNPAKILPQNTDLTITSALVSLAGNQLNNIYNNTAGLITINAGGTLSAAQASNNRHNIYNVLLNGGVLGGSGGITAGQANWYVNGAVSVTDDSTISASIGMVANNAPLPVDVSSGKTLLLSGQVVNITGTNGVIKTGAGTLTMSAANAFTGGATLNAGTININNASALGTVAGTFTVNGGSIDNTSAAAITTVNYPLVINSDFAFTGTKDLNLGAGAASLGTSVGSDRTITVGAGTLTIGGIIANGSTANSLIKEGAGALTLSGASTFTGGVVLNAGTLNLNVNGAAGNGPLGNGGTFTINGGAIDNTSGAARTLANNNPITLNGDFAFSTAGATANNNLTLPGAVTMASDRTITLNGAAALMLSGKLTNADDSIRTLTVNNGSGTTAATLLTIGSMDLTGPGSTAARTDIITGSGNVTISGVVADGVSAGSGLSFSGSGTLTLGSANTFTGPLNVLAGTVKLGNATAAGGGRVTIGVAGDATSGILDLNGGSRTLAALSTAGTATLQVIGNSAAGAATLNLTGANISTYGGVIQDGVGTTAVTLNNSGASLTLSGSTPNTYSGLTLVNAGSLNLAKSGSANAIAGGGLTIGGANNNLATVQYIGTSSDMMGVGSVTINGRGILDFNGKTDTIGNVVIDSNGATGTDATPIINTAGGGGLTIGSLSITPEDDLDTLIDFGTGALALGGDVTFTANVSGRAIVSGSSLSLGGSTRTFTVGLGTGQNYDLSVDETISGTVGIVKDGTGRLALSGVNTYTGPTTVNGGILYVNDSGSLNAGSVVNVANNATLAGNGTIGGTVALTAGANLSPGAAVGSIGTLTLTDAGASALTLNGNNLTFELPSSGTVCDLVSISGNLIVNNANTVIINAPGGATANTTFTIMTFSSQSGGGSFVFQNGLTTYGNLILSNEATRVTVSVGAGGFAAPHWNGDVSSVWDGGALNWVKNGVPSQSFSDGDHVVFDDSATTYTVTSGANVIPASVVFSNNANAYVVSADIAGTATTLKKYRAGSITLSGNNTYAGGTTFFAGSAAAVRNTSFGSGDITIAGSGTITFTPVRTDSGISRILPNNLTVNAGATLDINNATQYYDIGFLGVCAGSGTLKYGGDNNGNDGYCIGLFSSQNTFTGTIDNDYSNGKGPPYIVVNSIGDGATIKLNGGVFQLGGIAAYPNAVATVFNNSQINLTSIYGGTVNNSASSSASTLTINTPLAVSGSAGARRLTLGGSNTGANTFAGAISDSVSPAAAISVTKSGSGKWLISGDMSHTGGITISGGTLTLAGVNTYSGQTIFAAAGTTLILAGTQAVSPNTSFLMNNNASTSDSTVKLLDDTGDVDNSTVSVPNTFTIQNNNTPGNSHTFVVGNNNTANGGTSSGTTIGSTISIGTLNWNTYAAGTTAYGPIQIQGANGYRLQFDSVTLHNAANLTSPAVGNTFFTPTTANVSLGAVTVGTGNTGQGYQTLVLDGTSSDNRVTGAISDASDVGTSARPLRVTKSNTSIWKLSGNNTYTGPTTISGGTLVITSIDNVVNPNPLGQSSAAAANLVIGNGATLQYTGGAASTDRGFTLTGASATIEASGTGPLSFANTASPDYGTSGQTRKLILGGSNTGTNTLAASLADNGAGAVSVTKIGAGTWVLTGSSSYTGVPAIEGGTILVLADAPSGSNGAFGNSSIQDINLGVAGGNTNAALLIGGAFNVGRNVRLLTANTTDSGTRVLTLGGSTADSSTFSGNVILGTASQAGRGVTLTAASGGTVTFSGDIQNPTSMDATTYTVTKSGLGTVVFSTNAKTYTGTTRVSQGTLKLEGAGSLPSSTVIDIGGGGTLDVSTLTSQMTLGAGQTLQASGSTSGGTLATDSGKGMTLNAASAVKFTTFKPGVVPLTLSGAGTLALGANSPVTVTVANGGIPLNEAGSPYKLIAKGPSGTVTTLPGGALTVDGDGVAGVPTLSLVGGELYLNVSGAAAYKIQVSGQGSATVTAGNNINLTVTALDGSGATVSSLTRNMSLSFYGLSSSPGGNGPTVSDRTGALKSITTSAGIPNTSLSFVNGVATISGANNGVARAYNATGSPATLHCSDGGASSASGTGASGLVLTVNPGATAKLAFGVQPTTTAAGSAISPAVTVLVQDAYGNTVSGDSGTVTISSGNTSFAASTLAVNAVSSVATFSNLKPVTSGSGRTLTASRSGLTSATSASFTVSPLVATTLSLTSGNNQGGSPSTALASPFVVTASDVYGNGVSGVTVDFAIDTVPLGASGQSLSAASPTTAANGQAASTLTLGNLSGDYTVTATSAGLSGSPLTFTATVAPQPTGYTNLAAGTWSTDGNWANGLQPPGGGGGTVKIVMKNGADATSINDLDGVFKLNQISHTANTRQDLVPSGGSSLFFTNIVALLPSIRVANSSDTGRFNIYSPIELATNLTIDSDATSGGIGLFSNITETAVSSLTVAMLNPNNANGAATLTLGGSNSFSGGTTVNAGYLSITNDYALGAIPATPKTNLTLNGAGLISSNTIALHTNRYIRLGSGGGTFNGGNGTVLTIDGRISGPGGMTVRRPSATGFTLLLKGNNTYQGSTTLGSSGTTPVTLQLGNNSALPGGVLMFEDSAASTLDLNGFNGTVGALTAGTDLAVVDNLAGGAATLTAGNGNASSTFAGLIRNTAGTVGLTKTGSGTLTLSNTNSYVGRTTVAAGTLVLGLTNSIAGSTNISISAGGTLDVSAVAEGTFALGSATLTASGTGIGATAAAIKGTVDLGSQPVTLRFTPTVFTGDTARPPLLVSQGDIYFNNNVITVSNTTGTLIGGGRYRLLHVAAGVISGTPDLVPVITGAGLTPGSTASLVVSDDFKALYLDVTGVPADLAIKMTQSASLLDVGAAMSYSITVSNIGPYQSGAMIVSNVLGTAVGYVSSTPSGTHSFGVVTWSLPGLAVNSVTTLTLNVTASLAQGPFTNRATVNMPSTGYSDPVSPNNTTSLVAQAQCGGITTPFLTLPANPTVFANNLLIFQVAASNLSCATPLLSIGGKPAAASFSTTPNGYELIGTFTWTPGPSDVGTHPVTFFANNVGAGAVTNTKTVLIYVGAIGEPVNGSGVPLSQTNWHVVITNIFVPSSGNATVEWTSAEGVAYDLYSAPNNLGQQALVWTKEIDRVIAAGAQQTGTVAAASQKYLQVVPSGLSPGSNNLWAIIQPTINVGFNLLAAPVDGSDLKFDGEFGATLAEVLTGDNGGVGDHIGDEVYLLDDTYPGGFRNLYLDAAKIWKTSGGDPATYQLLPGQGIIVLRNSSPEQPVQPRFSGPVGNTLAHTNTINIGNTNLLTFSEGRYLTPAQAFANPVDGEPVGDYDETMADQLIFLEPNGSFRPVQYLPDGTWLDLTTFGSAGYLFTPGRAAYYIRQSSGGTLKVKF